MNSENMSARKVLGEWLLHGYLRIAAVISFAKGEWWTICQGYSLFQGVDGWQAYELHGRDRIAYLNTVENDTTIDSTSGNMKFDGTTFTITDLDKEIFGTNEFNYVITDKEFSPD